MRDEGAEYEWLSFAPVDPEVVRTHFANIRAYCLEEGRDILSEPIPVVPTQHYFMGGVRVDRDSATTMPCLYAAGETACNGVHGRNRLASNSLLEALVFARRAAWRIGWGGACRWRTPASPRWTARTGDSGRRLAQHRRASGRVTGARVPGVAFRRYPRAARPHARLARHPRRAHEGASHESHHHEPRRGRHYSLRPA